MIFAFGTNRRLKRSSNFPSFGLPSYSHIPKDSPSHQAQGISIRQNEKPLMLRGLITISRTALIPWAGVCLLGLACPIFSGFSIATALTSVTSAAFAFMLYHDLGYMNDVSKSMDICTHFPSKGRWARLSENRLNPSITITSLPESSTLLEGSVGSALRSVSSFGRGRVFMVDDSKKFCNRFGKQYLAAEWNKRLAVRNGFSKKIEILLLESDSGLEDDEMKKEVVDLYGVSDSSACVSVRTVMAREKAQEISDCLTLGYEMELEVAVRQICEKLKLSRATEARLTNALGILRTIKETMEIESIDDLADQDQRERAESEIITYIGEINGLNNRKILELINKWRLDRKSFLMPTRNDLLGLRVKSHDIDELYNQVTKRIKSEERRHRISELGIKLINNGSCKDENELARTIVEEFPEANAFIQIALEWFKHNRKDILSQSLCVAGEALVLDESLERDAVKMMRRHYLKEEEIDLKERIRMILEDKFSLSSDCAESFSVRISEKILRTSSPIFASDLERIIEGVVDKNLVCRGISTRLTGRIKAELASFYRNVTRAANSFVQFSVREIRQLDEFVERIAEASCAEEISTLLNKEILNGKIAEEVFPVFRAVAISCVEKGLTPKAISEYLKKKIPAIMAVGLSEGHRLVDFDASCVEIYKSEDFGATGRVESILEGFRRDWPDSNIESSSIPIVAKCLAAVTLDKKEFERILRESLSLSDKDVYFLAARIEKQLRESAIDIARSVSVELLLFEDKPNMALLEIYKLETRICAAARDHLIVYPRLGFFYEGQRKVIEKDGVAYVHRQKKLGGKAGALGDATGGYSIESRVKNMLQLSIETRLSEEQSGFIDVHAIPRLITSLDMEVCQRLPVFVNPTEVARKIMGRISNKENRTEIEENIANELKIIENPVLRRQLAQIINSFPAQVRPRRCVDIIEQLISQCRLPAEAEVEGRKIWLASALRIAAPIIDVVMDEQKSSISNNLSDILLAARKKFKETCTVMEGENRKVLLFLLDCISVPSPAVGSQCEVFVQFDGGRHINRDYLFENIAFYLDHPSLFLIQTRQHYGRNRWSHPSLVGADSDNDIFYEHIELAKTADNAGAPCGSGMVLPRKAWLWGGEWQEEVEGRKEISHIGGRIYYQIEDSVTEDMASGIKYHRLGYSSIFNPGVFERGLGPPGLQEFLGIQVYRWSKGIVGELRSQRDRGSKTTINELINNWKSFTAAQREQYSRSVFYYLTAIANVICLAAPMLFLLVTPVLPYSVGVSLMPVILFRLLFSAWIYPISMRQRGLPLKESIALTGFSLSSWERQISAAYTSLIRKKQGKFGVSRKEGAMLKMDIRTNIGRRFYLSNIPFIAGNFAAFLYGSYMAVTTGNAYFGICGFVGLLYSSLLTLSFARYNKGANPLPPRNGKELLKVITESDDTHVLAFAMSELNKGNLGYSLKSIDMAKKIHGKKILALS
ncbi:hypothetical protein A2282_07580 [candidate division WOR-1 bacterium RIFOXYA12_FULL_36_13]|nr:MAG: hypothetical protein A2282_07580 [candidate division WOR-1 bacterium RIFOXYA12_FULL_36_13]